MKQITIHQAKTNLSRFIEEALAGEEIVIARGKLPLVRIVPLAPAVRKRAAGGARGTVVWTAEDFDATLEQFKEYLP